MSNWLNFSNTANKLKQSYFNGFVDISGVGGLSVQNNSKINLYDGKDISTPKFSINSGTMKIYDGISTYYDISNTQLIYLDGLTQNINSQLVDIKNLSKHISNNTANLDTMIEFDTSNNNITLYNNVIPATANAYDLGSINKPFKSIYVNQGTIHFIDPTTSSETAALSYNPTLQSLNLLSNGVQTDLNLSKTINGVKQAPLLSYNGNVGIGLSNNASAASTLDISGTLTVLGKTIMTGSLQITNGDISLNGNLIIKNSVYEGGLSLSSKYLSINNPTMTGNATVPTMEIQEDLYVRGNTYLDKNIRIIGDTSMNGNLYTYGSVYAVTPTLSDNSQLVATTAYVQNQNFAKLASPTFSGTTTMTRGSITQKLYVAGDVSFNTKLYVYGNTTVDSSITVNGNSFLNSNLVVVGDTSMNGSLNVGGIITMITQSNNDNSNKGATTAYVQNQNFAKLSGAVFTGDISLNSRLFVNGDASFNGAVRVITQSLNDASTKVATTAYVQNQGYSTLASPTFTGNVILPTTTVSQLLIVNGDASFNANLKTITQLNSDNSNKVATTAYVKNQGYAIVESPTFTGTVTLPTTTVTQTLITKDLSMNGKLSVGGDVSMNGNMVVSGNLISNTQPLSDSSNKMATTAYVQNQGYAKLSGATFTGLLTTTGALLTNDVSINGNVNIVGNSTFIGNAYANTPILSDNSNKLATTAFIKNQEFATLSSPNFTGYPTAPTPTIGTSTNIIATTEFVRSEISSFVNALPDTLAAIQQLSSALSNTDASFATALAHEVSLKADKISPTFSGVLTTPYIEITQGLNAIGDSSFNNNLFVAGDISLNGVLRTNSVFNDENSNIVATTAYVQNQGYAKLSGSTFTGKLITSDLLVSNSDVSFNNNLVIGGNANMKGAVTIEGNVLTTNNVVMSKNLLVTGDVSLNGNVDITVGILKAKTPLTSENSSIVATTAYVQSQGFARLSGAVFTGDISMNSRLSVVGDVSINSRLMVGNDIITSGNLIINKNIYENGSSLVSKYATLESPTFVGTVHGITKSMINLENVDNTSDVNKPISTAVQDGLNLKANISSPTFIGIAKIPTLEVLSTLSVSGDVSLNSRLYVSGDISLNSKLYVSGDVSLNSKLYVSGDVSLNGNVYVKTQELNDNSSKIATTSYVQNQGYAKLNGAIFTGDVSFANIETLGNIYSDGNLTISNSATLKSDLNVVGKSVFASDISLNSGLSITKDVSMNGNLFIGGDISLNGQARITSPSLNDNSNKIATTSYVQNQGYAKLNGANFTGDVSMNSNLQVLGNTSLTGALLVGDISSNSNLSIGKDTSMNGNLFVNGNSIFKSNVILKSTLQTDGDVSMNGQLSILGNSVFNGNVNVSGNLYATTAETNENSTKVATTAYVQNQGFATLSGASFTGTISTSNNMSAIGSIVIGRNSLISGNSTIMGRSVFSGDVSLNSYTTAITQLSDDNSTAVATTAYIQNQGFAKLASPSFTGVPTAPTAISTATTSNQIATTLYVENKITDFFNAASTETLNAINQVSQALQNTDASFTTTLATQLNLKADKSSPIFTGTGIFSQNLSVFGDVSFNNDLHVNNIIYENGAALGNKYAALASPTFTGTVSGITKVMVGLSNVDNTTDMNKPVSTATISALSLKSNLLSPSFTGTVTAVTIDISNNLKIGGDASFNGNLSIGKTIFENGIALSSKFASLNSPAFTGTVTGITKSMVGLNNVDNTSDINKPVSTATQSALNLKATLEAPTFTGLTTITNNLHVGGDVSLNGTLYANYASNTIPITAIIGGLPVANSVFDTDVSGNAGLRIAKDSSLNGNLFVNKKLSINSDTNMVGSLYVYGKTNLINDVSLSRLFVNNSLVSNTIYSKGDVSFNTNLYVNNSIYENGESLITKYVTTNNPTFSGTGTFDALTVTGTFITQRDNKLLGNLFVGLDTSMNGNLSIGKTIFENGVSLITKYATLNSPTFTGSVSGITKTMVGLNNVDNTSDANKPISLATQTALDLKSAINSPSFTGLPLAPTATANTNTTQIATTEFVSNAVVNLIGTAPGNLNTLYGIASAINNDEHFYTTISNSIAGKAPINNPTFTGLVTVPSISITGDFALTDASINHNLRVGGSAIFNGDVSMVGNLYARFGEHSIPSTAIEFINNDYGSMTINTQRTDQIEYDDEFFETSIPSGFNGYTEVFYSNYSDLSLNGNLHINGTGTSVISTDLSLYSRLNVSGDVSFNNDIDLSGSLIAHSNINVYGVINQQSIALDDSGMLINYSQIDGLHIGNIADGKNTLIGNNTNNVTTGTENTIIGYNAGSALTSGSNNLILGYNSASSSSTASNEITLGNSSINTLRCQSSTITSLSDVRDKTNIEPIPAGLEFIDSLNPVKFVWNTRDNSKVNIEEFGFIAQELEETQNKIGIKVPNLVYDANPDKLEASYSTLLPIMVKAIQDLKVIITKQQQEIDALKNKTTA